MTESHQNLISIVSGASAMGDKAFVPNPINIRAGDKVIWKNTDVETHTVTSSEFDSGLLDPDQSFEYQFEKTGHYRYTCMIHPSMNGEVVVS
jgi:plastocyanin